MAVSEALPQTLCQEHSLAPDLQEAKQHNHILKTHTCALNNQQTSIFKQAECQGSKGLSLELQAKRCAWN